MKCLKCPYKDAMKMRTTVFCDVTLLKFGGWAKFQRKNAVLVFRAEDVLKSSESLSQREMLCTFTCPTRL
jgi:hypothetical protein